MKYKYHFRYIPVLLGLFVTLQISAQITPNGYTAGLKVNYVREWSAKAPEQSPTNLTTRPFADVVQSTQFFDGLGRPLQTVTKQTTPRGYDFVAPMIYDTFGREKYKFLPYSCTTTNGSDVSNDGNFKMDPFFEQRSFSSVQYQNTLELHYYGDNTFEASPLNRVTGVYSAGNSWEAFRRGNTVQHLVSTVSDSVRLWRIDTVAGSKPTSVATYGYGQLSKDVTADEQSQQTITYTDKDGHVVLKKVQLSASPGTGHVGWLCTYYVYDDLGNLRFVLQPKAVESILSSWVVSQAIADGLCFRYEYDQRKRMIIKKVPDAGEMWMVYDARDRAIMAQDSAMRVSGKWMVTTYDSLNRPIKTGLLTNSSNRSFHQGQAYNSVSYPSTASSYELLTQAYYDNYTWVSGTGSGLTSAMATTYSTNSSYFYTTYNTSPAYAVAPSAINIVQGMSTGTMTKVLGTASQYLYSVNFYDDHGRVVQSQRVNSTGGIDTLTTQYTFTGQPLRTLLNHRNANNTVQKHNMLTKMSYDGALRLKNIFKNVDGTGDQLIDSMTYDELGQLKTKYLGNNVDVLNYGYNIRGWLVTINKDYLTGAQRSYFGEELSYNDNTSVYGGAYANLQYNGNIAGMSWKGGDGDLRRYDFSYDYSNRFTKAAFGQYIGGSWDTTKVKYGVNNLSYDANGNILGMYQYGMKGLTASLIDQLTYSYTTSSNKLKRVDEASNDTQSTLGDFHYGSYKTGGDDYTYDGNGSLTNDNNKGIDTISYNHLHLPQRIHMKGKGVILYTYDANGTKLTKVTMDSISRHATTTLYVAGFTYQHNDTITNPTAGLDTVQFFAHEEGRARWAFRKWTTGTTQYKWEYDFFEKDHLGNTREVLTQQKDTAKYMATMEAAYRTTENALFYNIPSTCVWSNYVNGATNPFGTGVTNPNDSVSRISGSTPKEGPAIILKVMAGDVYKVGVASYWKSGQTSTGLTDATSDILSSLANGIIGISGTGKGNFAALTNSTGPLADAVGKFRLGKNPSPPLNPKAYLNFMSLDNLFNYDSTASGALPVGNADVLNTLATDTIRINKSGYLYIYLTNETKSVSVFFDNLSVTHYSGPLLEETHYYPFGLTMAGISDKALKSNYAENKFRFNKGSELQNKEFLDGSGLELYETPLRSLDPQLGRWWQVDSKPTESESPYSSMGNNPVLRNDPLGDSVPKRNLEAEHPEWFTNQNADGDQKGSIRNATHEQRKNQPVTAFFKNMLHGLASLAMLDAVDNISADVRIKNDNGDLTIGNGTFAALNIVMVVPVEGNPGAVTYEDILQGGTRLPSEKLKYSPSERGLAPIGEDGHPVELHHRDQTSEGQIDEMTRTDHRGAGNYKTNHSNTGQSKSKIDRIEFGMTRTRHWENEWDGGRFLNLPDKPK